MSQQSLLRRAGFGKITAVGDLGFGAWVAKTRRRLLISAFAVTGLFLGTGALTAHFMRTSSRSVTLNLVLITVCILLMLVTSFVQALAVGDLVFPGQWRERVILGKRVELSEDEEIRTSIGAMKDSTMPFYILCVVLLGINYFLYSAASENFFGYYSSHGYELTLLGSDDPDDRIEGLRAMAHPLNSEIRDIPELRERTLELVNDESDEVRGWAMWLVGELRMIEASRPLQRIVLDETVPDTVRARAAEALGYLRSRDAADMMAELLTGAFGRDELAVGLLRGLGLAQHASTAQQIAPLLNVEPYEIRGHAFWALGHTRNGAYREDMFQLIDEGNDLDECLAAEALKYLATEDDLVEAHARFATASLFACPEVVWESPHHWDDERTFMAPIVVGESVRAKYLKVIRTAGGIGERDFFATVANDASQPDEIRALARELALLIDQGQ